MKDIWNVHIDDLTSNSVIYKLTFPDGKVYIGRTERSLRSRLKEHSNKPYSKLNRRCRLTLVEKHIVNLIKNNSSEKIDVRIIAEHTCPDVLKTLEISHIKEKAHDFEMLNINHVF